jgi:hypothetical protein
MGRGGGSIVLRLYIPMSIQKSGDISVSCTEHVLLVLERSGVRLSAGVHCCFHVVTDPH